MNRLNNIKKRGNRLAILMVPNYSFKCYSFLIYLIKKAFYPLNFLFSSVQIKNFMGFWGFGARSTTSTWSRSPWTSARAEDIQAIKQKALKNWGRRCHRGRCPQPVRGPFRLPALMAGAMYEGKYPLATALGRPLIAKLMVDAAHEHHAKAVAHGCTGKGNDQVRFDVTFQTLDSSLKIIAPVREWSMTRPAAWNMPASTISASRPSLKAPIVLTKTSGAGRVRRVYSKTRGTSRRPGPMPGRPTRPRPRISRRSSNRVRARCAHCPQWGKLDGAPLIERLNKLGGAAWRRPDRPRRKPAGRHQVPRALRSPGGRHSARRPPRTGIAVPEQAVEPVQDVRIPGIRRPHLHGLWFGAFHQDLFAFVASNQRFVSGLARVKLFKGKATVVGRKSEHSLYSRRWQLTTRAAVTINPLLRVSSRFTA